jgi:hypothetical protein
MIITTAIFNIFPVPIMHALCVCVQFLRSGTGLNFRGFLVHVCFQVLVSYKTRIKYHASPLRKTPCCHHVNLIWCIDCSGALKHIKFPIRKASYKQPFLTSCEWTSKLLLCHLNEPATVITHQSIRLLNNTCYVLSKCSQPVKRSTVGWTPNTLTANLWTGEDILLYWRTDKRVCNCA